MKDFRLDYLLDGIVFVMAGMQVDELFKIIQLILGIIATLVSISFSIWKWWKKASSDGKITKEEVEELKEEFDIKKGKQK